MAKIFLKPGRERSVLRRHPWLFSGAIQEVQGEPESGETVAIHSGEGQFLAWGAYSPHSQICARIWSWDEAQQIDAQFFRDRLKRSIDLRRELQVERESDAYRLVYAESDGLPGLIVDRYAGSLVLQNLSSGVEYWRDTLADALLELTGVDRIYERSDTAVRELEGLSERVGALRGDEPPPLVEIREGGLRYLVDVRGGQKSGFYLDQRPNRSRLRGLSAGAQVLDCFAYSGGFTLSALAGGAESVLSVDVSAEALELARKNLALNDLPRQRVTWQVGDVFHVLRELRDRGRQFDLVILDPPKFAATASQAERAARGYKDINLLALKLLRPGGRLVTFSCSGGVSPELFQKILAGAALDAGVEAQILETLRPGSDHPVALNYPEGTYLKGFVLRVIG